MVSRQPGVGEERFEALNPEKAVSHEKAQKAQKKANFALTETFTEGVTTVSTPTFSLCAFCAFSWPSTAVFRFYGFALNKPHLSCGVGRTTEFFGD